MILPCECPSPAHCLEATGGEQGLTSDELELARLRRERIEQEATNLEIAGEISKLRRELAEMTGVATRWCAAAGRAEREHNETLFRCRTAAQILIEAIGSNGPENVEETAKRAVEALAARTRVHHIEERSHHASLAELDEVRVERDEAIAKFELLDDHRRADSELIERLTAERDEAREGIESQFREHHVALDAVTTALRHLVASISATICCDKTVLRDLEAARALIGGRS